MIAYFDASCLVTLTIADSHWVPLTRWLAIASPQLALSDFGLGEVVSALGARVRGRAISADNATSAIGELQHRLGGWERFTVTAADIASATDMVARFHLGLRLPDAIHLAIARRYGATIITSDEKQGDAAAALGIGYVDPTRPSKEPA